MVAAAQPAPAAACSPGANLRYVCGLPAPEDLVRVPGTNWIIASSLAEPVNPDNGGGGLALLDSRRRTATELVPAAAAPRAPYDGCAGPPDPDRFSTHGLSIRPDGRGRSTLFVVGHGNREAIEVFEVASRGNRAPALTWVGCVPARAGAFNNSVVGLPDGRIIVTDYLQSPATFEDIDAGRITGAVYVWEPGGVFEKLPGTDLSGPNGVEVTRDLRYLFVAVSGTSSVLRYELAATERPPVVIRPKFRTDNLRYAQGGVLLLAGPRPDPTCAADDEQCPETSVVAALNPRTLKLTPILEIPPEAAFSTLSSALVVGRRLWLGSAAGDRVAYIRLRVA